MKEPSKSRKPDAGECAVLVYQGQSCVKYLENELSVRQARIAR